MQISKRGSKEGSPTSLWGGEASTLPEWNYSCVLVGYDEWPSASSVASVRITVSAWHRLWCEAVWFGGSGHTEPQRDGVGLGFGCRASFSYWSNRESSQYRLCRWPSHSAYTLSQSAFEKYIVSSFQYKLDQRCVSHHRRRFLLTLSLWNEFPSPHVRAKQQIRVELQAWVTSRMCKGAVVVHACL